MEKRKAQKTKTPEEVAKEFWVETYAEIRQRIEESISDGTTSEERDHYLRFVQHLKQLPESTPVGGLEELIINHLYLVSPYLPWNEVRAIFNGLSIDEQAMKGIIFVLKPTPIEHSMDLRENSLNQLIDKACKETIDDCNKKIKNLSPLVKRLEKLMRENEAYSKVRSLNETVAVLRHDIELYRAIVRTKAENDKRHLQRYLIDKDLNKSPQKHKFWNIAVAAALQRINPYCHTDNCAPQCRKTHKTALIKVAELLKILYPNIWTEDVDTIASRIKAKEYRAVS